MAQSNRWMVWVGRVISGLLSLLLLMSATMKVVGGPMMAQGFAHLGIPESLAVPLAILEVSSTVLYLIPATSVLGAILLAGFLGGAVCSHLRVGDSVVVPAAIGVLFWLGLYLREERLRALLPLRRS